MNKLLEKLIPNKPGMGEMEQSMEEKREGDGVTAVRSREDNLLSSDNCRGFGVGVNSWSWGL